LLPSTPTIARQKGNSFMGREHERACLRSARLARRVSPTELPSPDRTRGLLLEGRFAQIPAGMRAGMFHARIKADTKSSAPTPRTRRAHKGGNRGVFFRARARACVCVRRSTRRFRCASARGDSREFRRILESRDNKELRINSINSRFTALIPHHRAHESPESLVTSSSSSSSSPPSCLFSLRERRNGGIGIDSGRAGGGGGEAASKRVGINRFNVLRSGHRRGYFNFDVNLANR